MNWLDGLIIIGFGLFLVLFTRQTWTRAGKIWFVVGILVLALLAVVIQIPVEEGDLPEGF